MTKKISPEEFLRLVRTRRSCRKFKPDPIPDESVDFILEAGRWAMSGANGQPWEFIVIKDQGTKDQIARAFIKNRDHVFNIERTRIEEARMPALRQYPSGMPSLLAAPVIIAVLGERRTVQASVLYTSFAFGEGGPGAVFFKNMANATQLLCLAAAALGLGAQWCSVSSLWEGSLKTILDVPEELTIHTLVPVGYPDYKTPPPYRRKLSEIVHYEKYDRSRQRTGEDIFNFILKLRKFTKQAYEHGI
ncbi:MAG: nitroreductase family protein [Dehalococcoidia bacterium]|nr:nitroreductase family protein [Dehalococcoidia bacterium]MDZ4246024.1 nitroreductase family protein [Dehalococcoidia bacterium]